MSVIPSVVSCTTNGWRYNNLTSLAVPSGLKAKPKVDPSHPLRLGPALPHASLRTHTDKNQKRKDPSAGP